MSVLSDVELGSSFSLASFIRIGSGLSVVSVGNFGETVSTMGDAQIVADEKAAGGGIPPEVADPSPATAAASAPSETRTETLRRWCNDAHMAVADILKKAEVSSAEEMSAADWESALRLLKKKAASVGGSEKRAGVKGSSLGGSGGSGGPAQGQRQGAGKATGIGTKPVKLTAGALAAAQWPYSCPRSSYTNAPSNYRKLVWAEVFAGGAKAGPYGRGWDAYATDAEFLVSKVSEWLGVFS